MLNATSCFVLAIAYLYASGIPAYNTPKWETSVNFVESLTPPAVAFLSGYIDAAIVNFPQGPTLCTFPIWVPSTSNNCPQEAFNASISTISTTSGVWGDLQAYVFNPTELASDKNTFTTLSDRLVLQIPVQCA